MKPKKRLSREEKRNKAVVDLINQMFVIADHKVTYEDIKDRKDDWYAEFTMTTAQCKEWWKWGVDYLRKNLKMNKAFAEREMVWLNLQWGLKIIDYTN